jgi:ubiquinol-cytochrome c reductase iron-sulfur subunit
MSTARDNESEAAAGPLSGAPEHTPAGELEVISSETPPESQINDSLVLGLSLLAGICALIFGITLTLDLPMEVYGGALALGLFALGYAVRRYFTDRFPEVEAVEQRLRFTDPDVEDDDAGPASLAAVKPVPRRPVLMWALLGSLGAFAVSLLAPISSLGPRTDPAAVRRTAWRNGTRVVDTDGRAFRPDDIPQGGVAYVWPEGSIGNEKSSAVLISLGREAEPPTNLDWVVEGRLVVYSKVCTHAGCPVALYRQQDEALFCPCHQSTFDTVRGASPTFGPAARALPQLPLGTDDDGYLIALDDFPEIVGPAYG